MLGLGLGLTKLSAVTNLAKKIINDYVARVTAAGGYLEAYDCALNYLKDLQSKNLLKEASWVLIPQGIKEDIVFTQKPVDGSGNLQFTRASDATRTNSAGVIERTPWNLFQFSEMFSDAYWTKLNATITANNAVAPDGTSSADRLVLTSVSPASQTISRQVAIVSSTTTITFSTFVKYVDKQYIQLVFSGGFSLQFANFDLINGTVTAGTYVSANVQSYADGWYRISITTTGLNTNVLPFIWSIDTALAGRAADSTSTGTSSYLIWGAQLVEGTDAKPYFATTNRQDVPRLDYRNADGSVSTCPRLLLEPQRTNSIRNSTMVGAVAGSPGTLPTNWGTTTSGLTQTIVGIGTENGLQYIDFNFAGTASGTLTLFYETLTQIVASNGQAWSNSFYAKLISGTANSFVLVIRELSSIGGNLGTGTQTFSPSSNLQRFTFTRTNSNALTAFIRPALFVNLTIGATYDFTIRIAAPQMELGAYATTFIPTTTAAVTRLAGEFRRSNIFTNGFITAAGGTWFVDLSNNIAYTRDASSNAIYLSTTANGSGGDTLGIQASVSGRLQVFRRVAGGFLGLYSTLTDDVKVAIKWNGTAADVFVNGVKVVTSSAFTATSLQFLAGTGVDAPKFINQSSLFPVPLTDDQCIEITTQQFPNNLWQEVTTQWQSLTNTWN